MNKSNVNWTLKKIKQMIEGGEVSFNHPIQRKPNQWDELQKSLLIHSIAGDYPIPAIYTIMDEGKYQVLDGKQRLTNLIDFMNNNYLLHEATPSVTIGSQEYSLAGKCFEELDTIIKDEITSRTLLIYKFEDVEDDEIEEMFYRLNNGTPLSKDQKTRAKMGVEMATYIDELLKTEFFSTKTNFSELQLKRSEEQTALLQSLLLLSGVEYSNFSNNEIMDFVIANKGKITEEVKENIKKAIAFINEAVPEKNKFLFKKINIPMIIKQSLKAMEQGITAKSFGGWLQQFQKDYKPACKYANFCGAGSVKKEKVLGRLAEMDAHYTKHIGFNTEYVVKTTKPVAEVVTPESEVATLDTAITETAQQSVMGEFKENKPEVIVPEVKKDTKKTNKPVVKQAKKQVVLAS